MLRSNASKSEADLLELSISRAQRLTVLVICSFLSLCFLAALTVKVDIYADAKARIRPAGLSKVIQPIENGKVKAIHVQNGSHIREGEVILELDPTENLADRTADVAQIGALEAEIARRNAIVDTIRQDGKIVPNRRLVFADTVDPAIQKREADMYRADLARYRATIDLLDSKIGEGIAQRNGLNAAISEQSKLVDILKARVEMWKAARNGGAGSGLNEIEAQSNYQKELTTLRTQTGELLKINASIVSGEKERLETVANFLSENHLALASAQAKRDQVAQALVKSSTKLNQTRLIAPSSGMVQEVAVTTLGQVVSAGQRLMVIVPDGAKLEAEALVATRDIAFIKENQQAVLKIEAYPFAIYGTTTGTVVQISRDAVDVLSAESSALTSTPRIENQVYPVTIALDKGWLSLGSEHLQLAPGMVADVHIRTGKRRIIDFFLSQIREATSDVINER